MPSRRPKTTAPAPPALSAQDQLEGSGQINGSVHPSWIEHVGRTSRRRSSDEDLGERTRADAAGGPLGAVAVPQRVKRRSTQATTSRVTAANAAGAARFSA